MNRNQPLSGQVAVVTGGNSGLGQSIAIALGRRGAHVVVVGRDRERLVRSEALVREVSGGRTLTLSLDVRSEADMQQMAERTLEAFGRIDVLVNSAGILRAPGSTLKTVATMPLRDFEEVIAVNLTGAFLVNRAVLPAMIQQRS